MANIQIINPSKSAGLGFLCAGCCCMQNCDKIDVPMMEILWAVLAIR